MPYLSRSIPHALYCLTLLFLLLAVPSKAALLENSVHETVLDNGLRLLMVERHASPTVTAYITFGVGAVDETSRQRGVAHLLEHMLFKGTKTIGTTDFDKEKEVLRKIEQTGERLDRLSQSDQADQEEIRRLEERLEKLQQRHKDFVVKDE
ncbi:MAG TPA: insulinase family protein, partial [Desulfuromonadales bacterium]|nr:insulinase family protein [Desulfuromonadales bacterium]